MFILYLIWAEQVEAKWDVQAELDIKVGNSLDRTKSAVYKWVG